MDDPRYRTDAKLKIIMCLHMISPIKHDGKRLSKYRVAAVTAV